MLNLDIPQQGIRSLIRFANASFGRDRESDRFLTGNSVDFK